MSGKKKNIVIINTVPVNGGDEALLMGTLQGIKDHVSNPQINVLCRDPILTRGNVKGVSFDWDWELVHRRNPERKSQSLFTIKKRIRAFLDKKLNVPFLNKYSVMLGTMAERRVYSILKNADLILSGAGSYLNDFYGYAGRMETLRFIDKRLKKPYIIFGQSVGPFWKQEGFPDLKELFEGSRFIHLREAVSLDHLKEIDFAKDHVQVTNDVAFYLVPSHALAPKGGDSVKNIILNFREWPYQPENEKNLEKATALCSFLINQGYQLTFLSTCQGIKGYIDDSLFANKIVAELDETQRESCHVIERKLSLRDFIKVLGEQDVYIGMRLHGAILSLLAGIPALNIGYEDKSKGVFSELGLDPYTFRYENNIEDWKQETTQFISDYNSYKGRIEDIRNKAFEKVTENFKFLEKTLNES